MKIKPRFSFHYVAYSILIFAVIFSFVNLVTATTPNPGHPWSELGDGVFSFSNGQTASAYTYTYPSANSTVLTTNTAVTVAQGGTGVGTLTGIVIGNGTSNMSAVTLGANQSIRRNSGDTAYEAFTPLASLAGAVLTSQVAGQTIGDTTNRLTKLWATDLTVTNQITGSVSGSAGSAGSVTNATLTTALTNNGGTGGTITWPAGAPTLTIPSGGGTLGTAAFTAATAYQAAAAALTSIAGLSWSSGSPLVKMTAAGTFGLDANTYLTTAGNAASATKSTNLVGGNSTTLLGSIPYQSSADTTTLLTPNTTAGIKYLSMTGNGTNGAAPVWSTIAGGGDMTLAGAQTVTGAKTFGTIGGAVGKLIIAGSSSGSVILDASAVASGTITLPNGGTLVNSVTTGNGVSATNTAGALAFTLGAIAPSSITSSGAIAANGGITFDAGTDTIGAFTAGGTIAMGSQGLTGTTGLINYTNFDVDAAGNVTVAVDQGLDTNAAGALEIGKTNATSVDICNGANCDTINIGNLATTDADTINIGDVLDNVVITDANWSITGAGALTVTSCVGCGGSTTKYLTANHAISSVTGTQVTSLTTTLAAGTYVFQYYLKAQSATTTVSPMFGVNFTGTAANPKIQMRYQSTGTTAITGIADNTGATSGTIHEGVTVQAYSTTAPNMGATGGVGAINSNVLYIIEGIITVTVSGDLQLWHSSETATSTTLMANSSLVIDKIAAGADLAEIYGTKDSTIGSGDVVSLDSSMIAGVKKSDKSYDSNVFGIVSTAPSLVMGTLDDAGATPVLVAFSGRVPVKVTTENGVIKPGDLLTSSSTPGVAMRATKAGQIVGQAMTEYSGEGVGKIMAFIKTDYSNGSKLADIVLPAGLSEDGTAPIAIENNKLVLAQFISGKEQLSTSVNLSEITTDRLMAGLEIITPTLIASNILTDTLSSSLNDSIVFNSPLEFTIPPLFNKDTAGFAVIKRGDRRVSVTYDNPYISLPSVSASLVFNVADNITDMLANNIFDSDVKTMIVDNSENGFTIIINKDAPRDLRFSWNAFAVKDLEVFESVIDGLTIEPTPVLQPEVSFPPAETPTSASVPEPTLPTLEPVSEPTLIPEVIPDPVPSTTNSPQIETTPEPISESQPTTEPEPPSDSSM